jgi:hypothetical protein
MAPSGKERAISPTLNTIIIGISVIVADLTTNISKAPIPEIAKPEPFYRLR